MVTRTTTSLLRAALVGLLIFLLSCLTDRISSLQFVDNIVLAVVTTLAFWQHERMQRVVHGLNHHIRNALQVVFYSRNQEHVARAKKRIEWALQRASGALGDPHPGISQNRKHCDALRRRD